MAAAAAAEESEALFHQPGLTLSDSSLLDLRHLFTALSPQLKAATHSLADPIVCPALEEIVKKWNK